MIGKTTKTWAQSVSLTCMYFDSIQSTNTYAKELATLPDDRFIVLTDEQTQGRGRNTNTWQQDLPGRALLSSWCFQVSHFPQSTITCRVGLALYESLKKTWPQLHWSIKAPNDIYIDEKKVAGILVELIQTGKNYLLIIGVGLNVLASPTSIDKSTSIFAKEVSLYDDKIWQQFLSIFYYRLQNLFLNINEELSNSDREKLIIALNQFPLLAEKYIELEPNGTLRTQTKTILWSEL
jgi:BirA family biotin operon repressor/biotin-[acetyl-CoA-carboxylase] ligase